MSCSKENFGSGQASTHGDDQVSARPLRWFLPGFFDGVEDDDVDTTLRLCPPGTFTQRKPKKLEEGISRHDDEKKKKKRKSRWQDAGDGDDEMTKKRRHLNNGEDERAILDPGAGAGAGAGGLQQTALLRGGSRAPVFLYKKKLDESDVKNRLFLKGGERVMEFLREGEGEGGGGGGGKEVSVLGVDGGGRVYEKLVMNKWASLNMIVINSDWNKVVKANKAHKGQIIEIWGYTQNHKPCLAFNFRDDKDGSSTTT